MEHTKVSVVQELLNTGQNVFKAKLTKGIKTQYHKCGDVLNEVTLCIFENACDESGEILNSDEKDEILNIERYNHRLMNSTITFCPKILHIITDSVVDNITDFSDLLRLCISLEQNKKMADEEFENTVLKIKSVLEDQCTLGIVNDFISIEDFKKKYTNKIKTAKNS